MQIGDTFVIGQEAICSDGLGRVVAFKQGTYVQVDTYVRNRSCQWAPESVQIIPLSAPIRAGLARVL